MTPPSHLVHGQSGDRGGRGVPSSGGVPSAGLVSSIVADCQRSRRERGQPPLKTTLDVSQAHEQAVLADATVVRRALEPLVRRALESASQHDANSEMPAFAEVVVTTVDLGDAIEIEVADSGPALPRHVQTWLNEKTGRSYHANVVPEGAGLALAAVRAVIARIGGDMHATNCPEGGVAITLRLPRRQARRMVA
ncbi:MAG: ATP-binding protein [Planctomycetia bacterium]